MLGSIFHGGGGGGGVTLLRQIYNGGSRGPLLENFGFLRVTETLFKVFYYITIGTMYQGGSSKFWGGGAPPHRIEP